MYQVDNPEVPIRWTERRFWTRAWQSVTPNVWYLGITSMLTDVSSEMVVSVLPAYLVLQLGLSPLAFGSVDGLYNGVTAITRWLSGSVADRLGRHKELAGAGYAISALSRLGLLAAGRAWPALAVAIAADRLGKGIRTVPRDALISLSARPPGLAQAFGVHRALDAAGALLGPFVAFAMLGAMPGAFDVVFVTSFCIAGIGVAVLGLFVENVSRLPSGSSRKPHSGSSRKPHSSSSRKPQAVSVAPSPSVASGFSRKEPQASLALMKAGDFRLLVITASGLALVTISDAFVYLALHERLQFAPQLFPLLYVGTAMSYLVLAIPVGSLADRFGRARAFLLGHVALILVYVSVLVSSAPAVSALLSVVLLGSYYAATDGGVIALASGVLPATLRGTGLGILTTATSLARLASSVALGWIWTTWSRETAIGAFGVALTAGVILASIPLIRVKWNTHG